MTMIMMVMIVAVTSDDSCVMFEDLKTQPRESQSLPKSADHSLPKSVDKPGSGVSKGEKTEKPESLITINKETQQLIEELQRQYSQPVFINDGVQQYMDDVKDYSRLSTAGDNRPLKAENCT